MKSNQHPCSWSLCSVINRDGRRIIILRRATGFKDSLPRLVKIHPVGRWKEGSKLSVQFAPEAASAFEPLIRHRLPARRRAFYQPKLQLLSPINKQQGVMAYEKRRP